MLSRSVAAIRRAALIGLLLGYTDAAQAQICVSPQDRAAFEFRHMQTQLMMGAIQCRGSRDLGQRATYNRFARENRPLINRMNGDLIAFFRRQHGRDYRAHLDRYVTDLANRVSAASRRADDFCTDVAALGAALSSSAAPAWHAGIKSAPLPVSAPHPACSKVTAARAPWDPEPED